MHNFLTVIIFEKLNYKFEGSTKTLSQIFVNKHALFVKSYNVFYNNSSLPQETPKALDIKIWLQKLMAGK